MGDVAGLVMVNAQVYMKPIRVVDAETPEKTDFEEIKPVSRIRQRHTFPKTKMTRRGFDKGSIRVPKRSLKCAQEPSVPKDFNGLRIDAALKRLASAVRFRP